ncbi:MAG: hypothetical protein CFE31_08855 [Rhizobiales bacterium PAR1]|nr:MAG: hypothetical protein CFE31_08855 [Rhizobiales bacterium PAR1]
MPADAPGNPLRIGLIGFGRIGQRLARYLAASPDRTQLVAILLRPEQREAAQQLVNGVHICTTWDEFRATHPMIAVECASAQTLVSLGTLILGAGIDLIPLSLAALVDPAIEKALLAAASAGPGRLEIAAGAMGSIDFLAAGRLDDLRAVTFRAIYPAARWVGTPAEGMINLPAVAKRTIFLRTSVREAAALFPRHINVAVGVALAGLGLDQTIAELAADPVLTQAMFEIDADAGPGPVHLTVAGRNVALGADPVDYTTFSVLRLLRRRTERIAI